MKRSFTFSWRLLQQPLLRLPRTFNSPTIVSTTITSKMAAPVALFSTSALRAANAQPYSSINGKLDPSLLRSLQEMGIVYMTPVQTKVMEMPSLRSDWYVEVLYRCCSSILTIEQSRTLKDRHRQDHRLPSARIAEPASTLAKERSDSRPGPFPDPRVGATNRSGSRPTGEKCVNPRPANRGSHCFRRYCTSQ